MAGSSAHALYKNRASSFSTKFYTKGKTAAGSDNKKQGAATKASTLLKRFIQRTDKTSANVFRRPWRTRTPPVVPTDAEDNPIAEPATSHPNAHSFYLARLPFTNAPPMCMSYFIFVV